MPSLQTTPPQHARGKSHGLRSRDGSFLRQLRQRARPSVFVAEDGYRPNITRQPFRVNRRNEAICWLVVSQYLLTVITFTLLTLYKCDVCNLTLFSIAVCILVLRSRSPRPTFEMLRAISLSVQHQHLFYTFLTLYNSDIVFKNITGRFYNALPLYIIQDCCLQPGAQ